MNNALNEKYSCEAALRFLMTEGKDLEDLYRKADALRPEYRGDDVYIRGIIEFSNKCANNTGSGFMIGLPCETIETLAKNILLCRTLDLDMIGIGPFILHPDTPLGNEKNVYDDNPEMLFKALATSRIFNPDAHIPATTAYDVIFPGKGRDIALQRGANIFMPNGTPVKYKQPYFLYPGKPYADESPEECVKSTVERIQALGRHVGSDPGHSIKKTERCIS